MNEKMHARKAISYIRMSTEKQLLGHSLERQLKATKDYCFENNLELVDSLQDIGFSGYSGQHRVRGQLGQFFDAMRKDEIERDTVLIVESLDRLSRQDPLTAITQFSEILTYGIELHTLFDGQIYTKESVGSNMGLLFLSIGSMIRAYDESVTKSKRLAAVWSKKKKNPSDIVTSQVPHWIEVIKDENGKAKSFALRASEANSIRKIFDLSIDQNLGSQAITTHLNKNIAEYPRTKTNSRNKDGGWAESYVKSIFNNHAVYGAYQPHRKVDGKRIPDGELIENYYPALISKERFLLNRSRMKTRTINGKGRKSFEFKNIFRGMLYCKSCGSKMSFKDAARNKGGPTIRCDIAKQSRGNCEAMSVRYPDFEAMFFKILRDVDFLGQTFDQKSKFEISALDEKVSALEHQKQETERVVENILDELLAPKTDSTVKGKLRERLNDNQKIIDELDIEIDNVKAEIADVSENNIEHYESVPIYLNKIDDGDSKIEIRRALNITLRKIFSKIEVYNTPLFFPLDVSDGLISRDDLEPKFLEWFDARKGRGLLKDSIEYIGSRVGYKKHQDFRTTTYVTFRNGTTRVIMHDGVFFNLDPKT
jgi:DNA invertase Pin-like site-specific DNA recombinase